jgi:protein arginine kinase
MSQLPETLFQKIVWNGEKNPIWIGSTLHLCRNLSLYKFPGKMSSQEMVGSLKSVIETLQKKPSSQSLVFFPAEKLSSLDKELLFEHFHCPQGFQETNVGQGFGIDPDGKTLITLNHHDHLQFHSVDISEDLVGAWEKLSQMEEEFGSEQLYAFSPRFGFLTANPMLCGTTLEARLFLHVPALRHTEKLHEILQNHKDEQLSFASLEGPLGDLVGDFLILKNRYTLGVAEETVLGLLKTTALKIALAEKTARDALKANPSPHIKDFIGRAFGLLMHSYELHPKEAIDALSAVKLGVDLGWIAGISATALSSLILQLRRGHLTHLLHLDTIDPEALSHKRAEWLHQELKAMRLEEGTG